MEMIAVGVVCFRPKDGVEGIAREGKSLPKE